MCIYIYIHNTGRWSSSARNCTFTLDSRATIYAGQIQQSFMYRSYYHFNNLRFNKSQCINDFSAAHIVI